MDAANRSPTAASADPRELGRRADDINSRTPAGESETIS